MMNNYQNGGNMFANPMQFIQQFQQFKSQLQGDPKQKVQELLNSGQMSQSQLNQLTIMANQYRNILK